MKHKCRFVFETLSILLQAQGFRGVAEGNLRSKLVTSLPFKGDRKDAYVRGKELTVGALPLLPSG